MAEGGGGVGGLNVGGGGEKQAKLRFAAVMLHVLLCCAVLCYAILRYDESEGAW